MLYMKWGAKKRRGKPVYTKVWTRVPLYPVRKPYGIPHMQRPLWQHLREREISMKPQYKLMRRYDFLSFYKKRKRYRTRR